MDDSQKNISVSITTATVVKTLAILLLLYFFFAIKDVLAILFVSLVLASAIDPMIDWMQKRHIPRGVGVALIYFLMIFSVGGILYLIIPPIIEQGTALARNFPAYLEKATSMFSALRDFVDDKGIMDNIKKLTDQAGSGLDGAAGGVFSTISGFFGGIVSFFLVMVLTFYMSVEEHAIKKLVWSLAPESQQVYIMHLLNRMQAKVGLWLRGQFILSFVIFILTYIALLILGVEYALVLALIAGMTEFVPYLGPALAAIPAIFLAFTQSPMLALFVGITYYIIQWCENNIIVPKVMQKVVGLNPIVSIAVLLIGFNVGGVVGAILSIPVATALSVLVHDVFNHRAFVDEENI